MAGHVFVVQADVTRLACDAWLVPTDPGLVVEPTWLASDARPTALDPALLTPAVERAWQQTDERVMSLGADGRPQPWLVNVGSVPGEDPHWFADGVREYLKRAGQATWEAGPSANRTKPLLALHPVGTGKGGAADYKGRVLPPLLDALYESAAKADVDIALVARSPALFAACQDARFKRGTDPWQELEAGLQAEAEVLGHSARDGHLVLFAGAGIGKAAGLPMWGELLRWLAEEVDLGVLVDDLGSLDELDQARLLANHLKERAAAGEAAQSLGTLIATEFRRDRYAISHGLLSALPISEAVTTNYDELLERAAESVGRPFTQIPYERASPGRRWLLKMHGSIDAPEDIVLTRDDYLSYGKTRGALAGLVQALLITRHMLFVGFSLRDDNFHRIAHDVREAVRFPKGAADDPFGTVLLLHPDPLFHKLWANDLRAVPVTPDESASDMEEGRRIEIFLDCLSAHAASRTAHLLDKTFAGLLDADEQDASKRLRGLWHRAEEAPDSPTWRAVLNALEEFSGDQTA